MVPGTWGTGPPTSSDAPNRQDQSKGRNKHLKKAGTRWKWRKYGHPGCCVLPALCQVAVGCTVVWSPHVQVPIPISSRYGGTVAP